MQCSRVLAPGSSCGYLPEQTARLEYGLEADLTPAEYMSLMQQGWRRFGRSLFRPRCLACSACQSLRVDVAQFHADRSQRRARKANESTIQLRIGRPSVSAQKLALYHRYHAYQSQARGWPSHEDEDLLDYAHSFVDNPFPTEEWCYFLGDSLVGVGLVDALPGGLSAIYFYYDPQQRNRSLGTGHVLHLIDHARWRGLPHAYLGYYVADCPSLSYKARFAPNEVLRPDGTWRPFRGWRQTTPSSDPGP